MPLQKLDFRLRWEYTKVSSACAIKCKGEAGAMGSRRPQRPTAASQGGLRAILRRTSPPILVAVLAWLGPDIAGTHQRARPGGTENPPIHLLQAAGASGSSTEAAQDQAAGPSPGVPFTSGCDPGVDMCADSAPPFTHSLPFVCQPPSCAACCDRQAFCDPISCSLFSGCHDSSRDMFSFQEDSHHCCTARQRPCDDQFELNREIVHGHLPGTRIECLQYDGFSGLLLPAESDDGPGCTFFCGDGVLLPTGSDLALGTDDDEECDDGNLVSGDGCDFLCESEPLSLDVVTLYALGGSEAGMQLGFSVAGGGQVLPANLVATPAFTAGAPGLDTGGIPDAGAAFTFDGATGNVIFNSAGNQLFSRMGSAADHGDFTGDGFVDPVACAPGSLPGGRCVARNQTNPIIATWNGQPGDALGIAVRYAQSKDGDPAPDVVAGASNRLIAFNSTGGDEWIYSNVTSVDALTEVDDVDFDGIRDVVLGDSLAPNAALNETTGAVTVLSGASGSVICRQFGPANNASLGRSVVTLGNRYFAGAPGNSSVFFANASACSPSASIRFEGPTRFGASVLVVNGALAVGAPEGDNGDGRIFLYSLSSGRLLATASGEAAAQWREFTTLGELDDTTGDGAAEVVSGAPSADVENPFVPGQFLPDAGVVRVLSFEPLDTDADGVFDDGDGSEVPGDAPCTAGQILGCDDNCWTVANPGQGDTDGDGRGDSCDCDADGLCLAEAYCIQSGAPDPDCPNFDADGDGIPNPGDLCPGTPFPQVVDPLGCSDFQVDPDSDGVCSQSAPSPGPSFCGGVDNCSSAGNPSQQDLDGDGAGDSCDDDIDGDGTENLDDCVVFDSSVAVAPSAVGNLSMLHLTNGSIRFAWESQDSLAGPSTVYDFVFGPISQLRSGQFQNATCLANDVFDTPLLLNSSLLSDDSWVLARAENRCGSGSYDDPGSQNSTVPGLRIFLNTTTVCQNLTHAASFNSIEGVGPKQAAAAPVASDAKAISRPSRAGLGKPMVSGFLAIFFVAAILVGRRGRISAYAGVAARSCLAPSGE